GTILASVGDGAEGKLWDVRRRKLLGNLPGIKGPVDAVAFAPDGKTLATVNRVNNQPNENYITIWDIVQRKQNFTIPVGRIGYKTVIFAGNAETLVAGAYGGRVDYWDLGTKHKRAHFEQAAKDTILAFILSHDNKRLTAVSGEPLVRRWDLKTGKALPPLQGPFNP